MPYDISYRGKGETLPVWPEEKLSPRDTRGVDRVLVLIETEPVPFRGLMRDVRNIQDMYDGRSPSESRILEAALYSVDETIVHDLSGDWELDEEALAQTLR